MLFCFARALKCLRAFNLWEIGGSDFFEELDLKFKTFGSYDDVAWIMGHRFGFNKVGFNCIKFLCGLFRG